MSDCQDSMCPIRLQRAKDEIALLRAELGHCATRLETAARAMGNSSEMAQLATQRYRDVINGKGAALSSPEREPL